MPVCSYFLKGICSNSNCPYSHLYVSRKTEVCSDFLKGYCPLGAKCKKHTLLCPDFAHRGICPRGSQCQVLHCNQKRHGRWTAATPIPGPSDGAPRSKASAGYVFRKPTTTQRPARQMSSGLTSRTEAPAFPPPSSRVLASTSTLSSKATAASSSSSPSTSSPVPSLDQEKLSLGQVGQAQEQALAASASCHPSSPCTPVQAQEARLGPRPPGGSMPRAQGSCYTSNHACEAPWGQVHTYLIPSPLERIEALPTTAPEEKQPATEPSGGYKQGYKLLPFGS